MLSVQGLSELAARSQWHQLGEGLLSTCTAAFSGEGDVDALTLFEQFCRPNEAHLSPLRSVQVAALAARSSVRARPYALAEIDAALSIIESQVARRERTGEERLPVRVCHYCRMLMSDSTACFAHPSSQPLPPASLMNHPSTSNSLFLAQDDAYLAALSEAAALRVWRSVAVASGPGGPSAGEEALEGVKAELAVARALLAALPDGVDPAAGAAFWRASLEYFRVRGPAASFYEAALAYLARTPMASLSARERAALAVDVALAALVGEGVYDFGEVNAHPILRELGAQAWLGDLLRAFQHGDIDAFNGVLGMHAADVAAAPALAASAAAMKEKITLLAVMELAASRPALGRAISFADVAAATRLPAEQAEWVLMRALALGLISGSMDEIARTVSITYVRPRVLDAQQISALAGGVRSWRAKADAMLAVVEAGTKEIIKA